MGRTDTTEIGIGSAGKKTAAAKKNIIQKMFLISGELGTVAKDITLSDKSGDYKAVSEKAVLEAVKPLEQKHGVYSYPVRREVVKSETIEIVDRYQNKTLLFRSEIKVTYRFVNIDDPEDFIEVDSFGAGIDAQDKDYGKAMTYADRYALMKAYKIYGNDEETQSPQMNEPPLAPIEEAKENIKKKAEPANEEAPEEVIYATDEEKAHLKAVCKEMKVTTRETIEKTGWEEGEKLTKAQYEMAMKILRESYVEELG